MLLEIEKLEKTYRTKNRHIDAIKELTFHINKGDHLAVIGPNGSGKTTLIKILTQLTHQTHGKVKIDGHILKSADRGRFGLMLGNSLLYHRLTVYQNLSYYAALYSIEKPSDRIDELLKSFDICEYRNDFVEDLSDGTMSKVAFIRAVLHQPEILILDEPSTGIDPIAAQALISRIKDYKTVIFSSHNLHDVTDIANKVLFLKDGKQVYFGEIPNSNREKQQKTIDNLIKLYQ